MKFKFYITFVYFFIHLLTINIQQTYSNDTLKSSVKGIFIDFEIKKNQDNRKNALQKSYLAGLIRYLDWITLSSKETIRKLTNSIEASTLVTSYSIENEKFSEERYSALITVNYDLQKIDNLLKEKNIKYYAGNGPKILVLPLMSFNNQLILWDDPNPWFETWIERPIDANLTDFVIPEGDVEDLIIISAEDARNLSFEKIRNLSLKYNVKQVIVAFLKIDEKDGKFIFALRCFDGLSKELLDMKLVKEANQSSFNLVLFDMLNSFTSLYDDYWVADNIKKIESLILVEANVVYESFRDWMFIKKIIANSDNVNFFKILKLSTKGSLAQMKIINENKFVAELENNNLSVNKKNNVWNIKKYF